MKQIWVTFCNITTAVVCSAGSNPFCWPFLQLTVPSSLAVRPSGTGLEGIVQTEKEASKGKCCLTGGGADTLNMLEQYSSASYVLHPHTIGTGYSHSPAGYTYAFHNRPALSSWIHVLLDFRISLLRFSFLLTHHGNSSFFHILMHFLNINSWSNSLPFTLLQPSMKTLKIRA